MGPGLRFPFDFEPALLQRDLDAVLAEEWRPHYNQGDFGGVWRGVALRSGAGSSSDLAAVAETFSDTPLLGRCPYFERVLETFQCPLRSVRLLSLAPGSFIREHSDHALDYEDGEIRIHIPIRTDPRVEFYVCGERLLLEEGGCYYVNVNLPHRVKNRSAADRVHLVIDATVNRWVRDLFEEHARPIPQSTAPPGGLEEFRKAVLADEELQKPLRTIRDRHAFIAELIALGAKLGFDFDEGDVGAGFRSNATPTESMPAGWTPVRAESPEVELLWTGKREFTEPFFEDTLRICRRNPFASLFRRTVRFPVVPTTPALAPSGFIFHMSRCGSTLVTRMLAALDRTLVISEAPPVDDVLQHSAGPEQLRWIVKLLGQPRTGRETHFILKLDAWHLHAMRALRLAFPSTPWLLVRRDPAEILKSWMRQPGKQSVPGALDPAVLRLDSATAGRLSRQEWCESVLARLVEAADCFEQEAQGLTVDYRDLPGAVPDRVARHFGLDLSPDEVRLMEDVARFDAKEPGQLFVPRP